MISGVPDEDAGRGTRAELVRGGRCQVGVAQRTKDPKLGVVGCDAEQKLERSDRARGVTRPPVDKVRRCGEGLRP